MAEPETAVNAGEQVTDAPTILRIDPNAQYRVLTQRMDALTTAVGLIAKPPQFRLQDALQWVMILVAFLIVGYSALGLSERIADVRTDAATSERRLQDAITAAENRLSTRLDKLIDQFSLMNERTSRLEGARDATKDAKPAPR